MLEGGFNLRKWNSNSDELLRRIQIAESVLNSSSSHRSATATTVIEEEETYAKSTTGNHEKTDFAKVLGVIWDCDSDDFIFDFFELTKYAKSLPPSKRSLLRVTAKIFDPLGLLAPFVIRLKVLFQLLCTNQCAWDDPLQGELHDQWTRVLSELTSISRIRIPRCYFRLNSNPSNVQLHGFCDASSQAYAAVLYLRAVYPRGDIEVKLIASKTRVAPLTKPTIPRLELLGAVLLSRLADTVLKSMRTQPLVTYWVDSTTVLYWIMNERPWKQYVSHRVQEIRKLTNFKMW